jgi:pyrroloquinoline quinone biosynthesis protein D
VSAAAKPGLIPRLSPGVYLRWDGNRSSWILLAPERVVIANDVAAEVLRRVDGKASEEEIVDQICASFEAARAEVMEDVRQLLDDLASKGLVAR